VRIGKAKCKKCIRTWTREVTKHHNMHRGSFCQMDKWEWLLLGIGQNVCSQMHKIKGWATVIIKGTTQSREEKIATVPTAPIQYYTRLCTATCQNKCIMHPLLQITSPQASQIQIVCTERSLNHELLSNKILKEMFVVVSNDEWSLSIVQGTYTNKFVARLDHL